jgi:hypothetical protein
MKNNLLIAHHWKKVGWLLTIPAFIGGVYFIATDSPAALEVTLPEWCANFLWTKSFITNESFVTLSLIDEVIALTLMTGLLLLAFSREKIEDEWIQQVRLESFQWAMLVNAVLLAIFILLTHGAPFLTVMVYNMFTPLLIFVARFTYILHLKPAFTKQPA